MHNNDSSSVQYTKLTSNVAFLLVNSSTFQNVFIPCQLSRGDGCVSDGYSTGGSAGCYGQTQATWAMADPFGMRTPMGMVIHYQGLALIICDHSLSSLGLTALCSCKCKSLFAPLPWPGSDATGIFTNSFSWYMRRFWKDTCFLNWTFIIY